MRVVCSYCRADIGNLPGAGSGVSHGMCATCDAYFERLWGGMTLGEYLDQLPQPILLVDEDARVATANRAAAAITGQDPASLRGHLTGEAVACARSRLPEGCGKTEHCRDCAIRRTVESVARTGRPARRVRAFLATDEGRAQLAVSVAPDRGLFLVTIEQSAGSAA